MRNKYLIISAGISLSWGVVQFMIAADEANKVISAIEHSTGFALLLASFILIAIYAGQKSNN